MNRAAAYIIVVHRHAENLFVGSGCPDRQPIMHVRMFAAILSVGARSFVRVTASDSGDIHLLTF